MVLLVVIHLGMIHFVAAGVEVVIRPEMTRSFAAALEAGKSMLENELSSQHYTQ